MSTMSGNETGNAVDTSNSANTPQLTSTTAPGKVFSSRQELAEHYKSDYHKYNCKRRQAGLPLLHEADFEARLQAAQALQQEKQAGVSHLKQGKQQRKKKKHAKNEATVTNGVTQVSQAEAYDRLKQEQSQSEQPAPDSTMDTEADETTQQVPSQQQLQEEAAIEIEPRQCLFDAHYSESVATNVERMQRKYGFFVPDYEYLVDLEGLVGYCHEKIKLGHFCLYCHRIFTTYQGCQKHMISKRHTKLRYEAGIDLEDLSVFYDFGEANKEFLGQARPTRDDEIMDEEEEAGSDDDWEDITDDEAEKMETESEEEEEGIYDNYQDEVARMGFDVTPLGELVFPDGRIVGHRALRRYYKQRVARPNNSAAVVAARSAAGERLFRGRVYNLGNGDGTSNNNNNASNENALALRHAGIAPGLAAGRAGKGILVPSGPGAAFSQISVYRYRAAIRKQRRQDAQSRRLQDKSRQNINRMDKKANRLMNNVSVAHALR